MTHHLLSRFVDHDAELHFESLVDGVEGHDEEVTVMREGDRLDPLQRRTCGVSHSA